MQMEEKKALAAAIIASSDAAPILQSTEHIFDFVAPLVRSHILGQLDLRLPMESMQCGWHERLHSPPSQSSPKQWASYPLFANR
jgi:hypothetical protein